MTDPFDYPNRVGDTETTIQYARRLARCVVTDLVVSGLIPETHRAEAVEVAAAQIFSRLAVGDASPPPGTP